MHQILRSMLLKNGLLRVGFLSVGLCCLAPIAAFAGNAFDEIRGTLFGNRSIEDGRGIVALSAPYRPENMRAVPISVAASFTDGRTIKAISVILDENPTPLVAVFHPGQSRDTARFKSNFRVDRQSDVRAVIEASDGKLYMASQLIKFAGGQASCSAPPAGDPAEIAANMGKMQLTSAGTSETATTSIGHAKFEISHPNHTGMVMDQQTLLYTPVKMVSEISVRLGGEVVFTAEGSIALSQNPQVEFDYKRTGAHDFEVSVKDTDGETWTKKFELGPQS